MFNLSKEIIFYTDNQLDPKMAKAVQDQLSTISSSLKIPIICSSLKPISDFGNINIDFPNYERGHRSMFTQILNALEKSTADIVFFCEHDVLYHPSHFDFTPPNHNKFYYNQNWWMLRLADGHAIHYDACKTSGLCGYRKLLLDEYKNRYKTAEENHYSRNFWYEPGTKENNFEVWKSEFPIIDIRHDANLTNSYWKKSKFRDQNTCKNWQETDDEIPGWGKTQDLISGLK